MSTQRYKPVAHGIGTAAAAAAAARLDSVVVSAAKTRAWPAAAEVGRHTPALLHHGLATLTALATRVIVGGKYWNVNFTLLTVQALVAVASLLLLRRFRSLPSLRFFDLTGSQTLQFLPIPLLSFTSAYLHLHALQTMSLPSYVLITSLVPPTARVLTPCLHLLVRRIVAYLRGGPAPAGNGASSNPHPDSSLVNAPSLALCFILIGIYMTQANDWAAAQLARGDPRAQYRIEPWEPVKFVVFTWLFVGGGIALDTLIKVYRNVVVDSVPGAEALEDPLMTLLPNYLLRLPLLLIFTLFIEDLSCENFEDIFPSVAPVLTAPSPYTRPAKDIISLVGVRYDSWLLHPRMLLVALVSLLAVPTVLARHAATRAHSDTSSRKHSVSEKHGQLHPIHSSPLSRREERRAREDVIETLAKIPIALAALWLLPLQGGVNRICLIGLGIGLSGSVIDVTQALARCSGDGEVKPEAASSQSRDMSIC